jgi:hypothetical protein
MAFETRLQVEEVSDGIWRLMSDLKYQGKSDSFIVPEGFITDFASVPRLFRWLVPTSGEYTKAAVLHDWLLQTSAVSRRDADGIFRRVMRELDVQVLRRYVMWAAVRVAGRLRDSSPREVLLVLLLALVILPVAIPGTLIVIVGLVALWAAEVVIWAIALLRGKHPAWPMRFWWA